MNKQLFRQMEKKTIEKVTKNSTELQSQTKKYSWTNFSKKKVKKFVKKYKNKNSYKNMYKKKNL